MEKNIFIKILEKNNLLDCFLKQDLTFIENIKNIRQQLNVKAQKNNKIMYNWFGTIEGKQYPLNLARVNNNEICKKEFQIYCIDCRKPIKKYTLSKIFPLRDKHIKQLNDIAPNFFIRCKHCSSYKNGVDGQKKRQQTCMQKYGVPFTSQTKEKIEKTKITFQKKYGKEWKKIISKNLHYYWKDGKFYRNNGDDPEIRAKQVTTWKKTISKKTIQQLKAWRDKIINKSQSNISKEFFNNLTNVIEEKIQIEYVIKDDKRSYFLDGYIENSCIIQFYGNYWHANPQIYRADEIIRQNKKLIPVTQIWKKDQIRIEGIQKILNLPIVIIWELDYIRNKDAIIEFLKQKIKLKELENGKIYQLKI